MSRFLLSVVLLICLLTSAKTGLCQRDSLFVNRLSVYVTPSAWLDAWDGSCTRIGVEIRYDPHVSICLDGGVYFHQQPKWTLKQDINGFEFRPMIKYSELKHRYNKKKKKQLPNGYIGDYIGVEAILKHQVFNYEDSIHITNGPRYDKWYSIDRYVAGLSLIVGENVVFRRLTIGYYGGLGIRFKHSVSNLSDVEKSSILTGEGHGDLIGNAERSTGNHVFPVISLGFNIGVRVL